MSLPWPQAVQVLAAKLFPSLAPHITAVAAPDTFPSDVEEEANGYFQVRCLKSQEGSMALLRHLLPDFVKGILRT